MNFNKFSNVYNQNLQLLIDLGYSKTHSVELLNDLFTTSAVVFLYSKPKQNYLDTWLNINNYYPYLYKSNKKDVISCNHILNHLFLEIITKIKTQKDLIEFEKTLGSVFEKHVNRKETGSYYTPEDTTRYIIYNSVFTAIINKLPSKLKSKVLKILNINNPLEILEDFSLFEENIVRVKNNLNSVDLDIICNVINSIKIIDPTCGSGAFIIESYNFLNLMSKILFLEQNKHNFFENLYGIDIMEEAILITRQRALMRIIIEKKIEVSRITSIHSNFITSDFLVSNDWQNLFMYKNSLHEKFIFDCVLGNPPYVESKIKNKYTFKSKNCGNLYAYTIEQSINISNKNAIIAFVVPLPFISTSRMSIIKKILEENSSLVYYSSFADRPGSLFTGVHQRLLIFFAQLNKGELNNTSIFTSSYQFWYNNERQNLFKKIRYIKNNFEEIPKIGNDQEEILFNKYLLSRKKIIPSKLDGKYSVYVSSRVGFWTKAFLSQPDSKEFTAIRFEKELSRRLYYCFVNSSLFYFLWILISDCWHITKKDLETINFDLSLVSGKAQKKLFELSDELNISLEENKKYINTRQVKYEYKHKLSKLIIDKIDDILCEEIGLNKKLTNYIKNFNIKYRMNDAFYE
jgi:hypothetical protein